MSKIILFFSVAGLLGTAFCFKSDINAQVLLNEYKNGFITELDQNQLPVPLSLIVPLTKWCGPGNIAKDYNDLGIAADTDRCCRAHDHCKPYINTKSSGYNLRNNSPYTRLHCRCDKEFSECLKKVKSITSIKVGHIYFNAQMKVPGLDRLQCFRKAPPITGCIRYEGWLWWKRCVKYSFDRSKPHFNQWFDVPPF